VEKGALAVPVGFREKRSTFEFEFYAFKVVGQQLEGVLVGTRLIEGETRFLLREDTGKGWILPNHADLRNKLADVRQGTRVVIVYVGREQVKTKRGSVEMARYLVGIDETTDAEQAAPAGTDNDRGVPFS